jgi:hypothetical protein
MSIATIVWQSYMPSACPVGRTPHETRSPAPFTQAHGRRGAHADATETTEVGEGSRFSPPLPPADVRIALTSLAQSLELREKGRIFATGVHGLASPDAEHRADQVIAQAKEAIAKARHGSVILAFMIGCSPLRSRDVTSE